MLGWRIEFCIQGIKLVVLNALKYSEPDPGKLGIESLSGAKTSVIKA